MTGNQTGAPLSKSNSIFLKFYLDRGLPEDIASQYANYAARLQDQGLPVVFEIEHLSHHLNLNTEFLAKAINSPENFYREFSIEKKLGGSRQILSPYPSLSQVQTWIKQRILDNLRVSKAALAYKKNTSIIQNAHKHSDKKVLLTIDIKDFFGTIKKEWVINLFRKLGYSPQISFYFASLCCHSGSLPQGAPTSPVISNIICRNLDNRLEGLSKAENLTYTRYADDLAFSGDFISPRFSRKVISIVTECHFEINDKKTRLMTSKNRKVLTGINVASSNLSLTRSFKRELIKEEHFIEKFGIRAHMNRKKIRDPLYIDRLIGKANYWHSVESWNIESLRILNSLKSAKKNL